MLELSSLDFDKVVHKLIQNLGLKVGPVPCRKFTRTNFISHVDKARKATQELLCIVEKIKDVALQQNVDFTDERDIKRFIEEKTRLFDKLIYSGGSQILTSHLRNINRKIVQTLKVKKGSTDDVRKMRKKSWGKDDSLNKRIGANSLDERKRYEKPKKSTAYFVSWKENNLDTLEKRKRRRISAFKNTKMQYRNSATLRCDRTTEIKKVKENIAVEKKKKLALSAVEKTKSCANHDLTADIVQCAKTEIETAEKFLRLCIKDVEFIKKYVHITLYINTKELNENNRTSTTRDDRVLLLCQHAILCLIEPSERAFVKFEDDLSVVIQKYLKLGCKYHFDPLRDCKDSYCAVLVLSRWAKVLIKHPDTTVMHTICNTLECNLERILVLSFPDE